MDAGTPKLIAALTNAAQAVKAAKGGIAWGEFYNPGNAVAYVQLFDKAAADVVLGTDVPKLSIGVPAGGRSPAPDTLTGFFTAISAAATSTANGAVAPNAAVVANFVVR